MKPIFDAHDPADKNRIGTFELFVERVRIDAGACPYINGRKQRYYQYGNR